MSEHEPPEAGPEAPQHLLEGFHNGFVLLFALGCFFFYFLILGLFPSENPGFVSLALPPLVAIIAPIYLLFRMARRSLASGVLLSPPRTIPVLVVGGMMLAAYLPLGTVSSIVERIFPASPEYLDFFVAFKPAGTLDFMGKAVALTVIVPLAEEILFRGIVQHVFHYWMTPARAVVLGAACFAAAHLSPWLMPTVFLLGLLFGYLYAATENLTYPIAAHAVYNLTSLIHLHATPREEILAYRPEIENLLPPIVGTAVFVLLLRVFRRLRSARPANVPDTDPRTPEP
jgi:membrane protease YdiL (CAAX protease family)